jgi:hypothetical protein
MTERQNAIVVLIKQAAFMLWHATMRRGNERLCVQDAHHALSEASRLLEQERTGSR